MPVPSKAIGLKATSKVLYANKGVYIWVSGARYEGDWINNLRSGKGKMYNVDGKIYEGDFRNNKKEGFGRYFK